MNLISDIRPNYLKLDMNLVRGIDSDSLKYTIVKGLQGLSQISNIHLIAEGIEISSELETLINLGIKYGQGYLIQKPCRDILPLTAETITLIHELNRKKSVVSALHFTSAYVEALCTVTETIPPNTTTEKAYDIMKHTTNCIGLCIAENQIVQGTITMEKLALALSGHIGGDDFVVITKDFSAPELCRHVVTEFEKKY